MEAATFQHIDLTGYQIESYADVEQAWSDYLASCQFDSASDHVLVITEMQARCLRIEINRQLIERGEWHMVPVGNPTGLIGLPCEIRA
jgi:hypothetical protein